MSESSAVGARSRRATATSASSWTQSVGPREPVTVLFLPPPPPASLLEGFDLLHRVDGLTPWRPARFLASLARARGPAKGVASLLLSFAPSSWWRALLAQLTPAVRRRLGTPISFEEAAAYWRTGAGLTREQALLELVDAWDDASPSLPELPRPRTPYYRAREPGRWPKEDGGRTP